MTAVRFGPPGCVFDPRTRRTFSLTHISFLNLAPNLMSTITELRSSNVKRLTAITITPPTNGAVVIGGKNGQGKSSCLDSILYALAGKTMPRSGSSVSARAGNAH